MKIYCTNFHDENMLYHEVRTDLFKYYINIIVQNIFSILGLLNLFLGRNTCIFVLSRVFLILLINNVCIHALVKNINKLFKILSKHI